MDRNGDGEWDELWKDLDPRNNIWEAKFSDPVDGMEIWQTCHVDTNADGFFDTMLKDVNGNGTWDEEYRLDIITGEWLLIKR